jgi:hypothetical protein
MKAIALGHPIDEVLPLPAARKAGPRRETRAAPLPVSELHRVALQDTARG